EQVAKDHQVAPFALVGKKLSIGALAPQDQNTLDMVESLKKEKGLEVSVFMVSHASLEKAWSRYADINFATKSKKGALDIPSEEIEEFLQSEHKIDDVK